MINQTDTQAQDVPMHFLRRAWMEAQGLTNVVLSRRFGISSPRVSVILRHGLAPQRYIDILRDEYAMPEHLLPAPSREKSGPLPGAMAELVAENARLQAELARLRKCA